MHLQGVIRAEERIQVMGDLAGQLPVQPLKGVRAVQLIQAGMPEQITGEVVAVTEVLMGEETAVEAGELPFHGRGRRGIRCKVRMQHRRREQPLDTHRAFRRSDLQVHAPDHGDGTRTRRY